MIRGNNLMYVIFNGGFAIDRAHKGFEVMPQYPKVLLIIRNYKECLIRQFKTKWQQYESVEDFLTSTNLHTPPLWYIENIKAFEAYNGVKACLYYEDMVNEPIQFLDALKSFLNLNDKKIEDISHNLPQHQKKSVELYTKRGKKSYTSGKKENLESHSKGLTDQQRSEFDRYYQQKYPELYAKYLNRYSEDSL